MDKLSKLSYTASDNLSESEMDDISESGYMEELLEAIEGYLKNNAKFINFDSDDFDITEAKASIAEIVVETLIENFNKDYTRKNYLYLDAVVPIKINMDSDAFAIKTNKHDSDEYINDVSRMTKRFLDIMRDSGCEDMKDVVYMAIIDIIPKGKPIGIIKNGKNII